MRLACSLLLLAAAPAGWGADPLRPAGPVTVTADHAEWQEGGVMRYRGSVLLHSQSLQLSGDTLELRQAANGEYQAIITGKPARLTHAASTDRNGKALPAVTASAARLDYDSRSAVIDIAGGARMARGSDEISGEEIHYNARERRIQAAGGSGGQVKIVIQAPPGSSGGDGKP